MLKLSVRATVPDGLAQPTKIFDMMGQALDRVAKIVQRIEQDIVGNWKNKPDMVIKDTSTQGKIARWIGPEGENRIIWVWVTKGTEEHDIPSKKDYMTFHRDYTPKTFKGFHGGPGTYSGPRVKKRLVKHPGAEPRNFEDDITRQVAPQFNKEVISARNEGVSKYG